MFLLIYISCDSYQRKHLLTYIFLLFFVCPTNSSSLLCLCIYCLPSKFAFFTVDVFIACPTNLPSLLLMYLLLAQQICLLYCLCIYCLPNKFAFFTVYVFIACPTDAADVFLVLMKHDILAWYNLCLLQLLLNLLKVGHQMTILVKFGFELHKTSRICAKGQIGTIHRKIYCFSHVLYPHFLNMFLATLLPNL